MTCLFKKTGADHKDLLEIYIKQVRPILEYGVHVWNSSMTLEEENLIERVQKALLTLPLGEIISPIIVDLK